MKKIFLTQGQVALVDDDMFEELNQYKWYAQKQRNTFYAKRNMLKINGKHTVIRMHHVIEGKPPKGFMTDHKNGQGLDNQRKNLRFVTNRQNQQNRKNACDTSKHPGVSWYKITQKWLVHIVINGTYKHLGYFKDEKEAFEIYRQAVHELGEELLEGAISL